MTVFRCLNMLRRSVLSHLPARGSVGRRETRSITWARCLDLSHLSFRPSNFNQLCNTTTAAGRFAGPITREAVTKALEASALSFITNFQPGPISESRQISPILLSLSPLLSPSGATPPPARPARQDEYFILPKNWSTLSCLAGLAGGGGAAPLGDRISSLWAILHLFLISLFISNIGLVWWTQGPRRR